MKISELLEGISNEVYHYTRINVAAEILTSGEFILSSAVGNKTETDIAPAGYPYFLSTTRSKVGGYHKDPGPDAVLFVLDGRWYNQRYKGRPVDYWGDRHNLYGRESEAEDRIFSKEPTIPITGVKALHIYLSPKNEGIGQYARSVMLSCKNLSIPAYLYTDKTAWLRQDVRGQVSMDSIKQLFRGPIRTKKQFPPARYAKLPYWLELIHKTSSEGLSPKANLMAGEISRSPSYNPVDDFGLGNEMANARKPNNEGRAEVEKMIRLMRAHGWTHPTEVYRAIKEKWGIIRQKEYDNGVRR